MLFKSSLFWHSSPLACFLSVRKVREHVAGRVGWSPYAVGADMRLSGTLSVSRSSFLILWSSSQATLLVQVRLGLKSL